MNIVRWFVAGFAGATAWVVAVAGNSMTFWPKLGMWLVFWLLLHLFAHMENKRD